jgi:hypothetical protein
MDVLKCNKIFLSLPSKEFTNKLLKVPVGLVITEQVTESASWGCNY